MNPFAGTWIANIEKSHRHANHQFQSATLTFEVTGDALSMTHAGVNMSGKSESVTTVLIPDGLEHPMSPQAPGVVTATRWIGTHVLESEAKKDGRRSARGPMPYRKTEERSPRPSRERMRPARAIRAAFCSIVMRRRVSMSTQSCASRAFHARRPTTRSGSWPASAAEPMPCG